MASSISQPALDDDFYALAPDEIAFFKSQTGIQSDEDLKRHIIAIQTKAYEVHPYPCIRRFAFTTLKISRLPPYDHVLKLGRERTGAILLDIGCCFGNDVRKAIADGYPTENVIASDLRQDFWNLGHELFKSTPESFPVPFIAGDAFDPAHIAIIPPVYVVPSNTPATSSLNTLSSLNPLHGQIAAIHASAFFHLFSEEQQVHLARALASLLSPLPGSVIFGQQGGRPVKGYRTEPPKSVFGFLHSPDSWRELWDGAIFIEGTVKVEAELKAMSPRDLAKLSLPDANFWLLTWSVRRL